MLMHIGIDTVALKGEGFHPRVKVGDKVRAGTPLIEFDLDFLATHAKSLLTQIVIANSERVTSWERASGYVSAGKDTLFTVTYGGGERRRFGSGGNDDHLRSHRDSESHRTARAARGRAGEPGEEFPVRDQAPARRPAGQCAQRDGDHGAGSDARGEGAGGGQRPRRGSRRGETRRGARRKAAATRAARRRRRRRRRPYPPRPRRRRGASRPIPICCSACRPRPGWRSARSSRSAARRS